jgi:hypothetical protein
MKHARLVTVALVVLVALGSCSLLGVFGKSGIVGWNTNPRYDTATEEVYFTALFQYDGYQKKRAVDIEYQLLDGTTVVADGKAKAGTWEDSSKSWLTDEVRVPVPQATYGGKTIVIFLDPDQKLLGDQWADPSLDPRKKSLVIPD